MIDSKIFMLNLEAALLGIMFVIFVCLKLSHTIN